VTADEPPRPLREERSSTHAVLSAGARFAVVEIGPGHKVRRVVTLFGSEQTAELFAVESGWSDFAVAPASIVTALRD
jgi:hypothetical protein